MLPGRDALGPMALMILTGPFSIVFWYINSQLHGDVLAFWSLCRAEGFGVLASIWPSMTDPLAWKMILSFLGFELFLMKAVPGKRFEATLTPQGNRPVYTANGLQCYLITLASLIALDLFNIFDPATIYDKMGEILASMNIFAWAWCVMLVIKGKLAPSSTDSGTTGSAILDFYWGMELYPRIMGWDVKMFTNCRAGMMYVGFSSPRGTHDNCASFTP